MQHTSPKDENLSLIVSCNFSSASSSVTSVFDQQQSLNDGPKSPGWVLLTSYKRINKVVMFGPSSIIC